jgi:hypothetical protein
MDTDKHGFGISFCLFPFSFLISFMDLSELAKVLVAMGCPPEKSAEMASQLDKRAKRLAERKGRSYDEALRHLLTLIQQGFSSRQ